MDTRLTTALKSFLERYPDALQDHKRVAGWLADHAPTERRAIRGLAAVSKRELPEQMSGAAAVDSFTFRRWSTTLTNEEALPVDLAEASLLAWLDALGIEAPESEALRGPVDKGQLTANLDTLGVLHLALEQAGVPSIHQVRLESTTQRAVRNVVVEVVLAGAELGDRLRSTTWRERIDLLAGKETAILGPVTAHVGPHVLTTVDHVTPARWWVEVKQKDDVLLRTFRDVQVLPPATWLGERGPRIACAAFVQPDDPVVAELVDDAGKRTDASDPRPGSDRAVDALLDTVRALQIPLSTHHSDKVASARGVLCGSGTALDLALVLLGCIEFAGFSGMFISTSQGPAVGVWGSQGRPALTETDDPELLRRVVASGQLTLIRVASLERVAERFLGEETLNTLWAVDVDGARAAGVVPLPPGVLMDGSNSPSADVQRVFDRAALSDASATRRRRGAWGQSLGRTLAAKDVPPRVHRWKQRLLDLTMRNPLLNLRTRATSLPLMVDALGPFEDLVSDGRPIKLMHRPQAERPGLPTPEVTPAMMTGALNQASVFVDLGPKRTVNAARGADRTMRTFRDEGGVHALFLVLGQLQFFEHGKKEPRRAPLVLVPVALKRLKNVWHMRLADQEPEFNAALLEYLKREFGLEIPGVFPLPMDAAGLDIDALMARVQDAIDTPACKNWTLERTATLSILAFTRVRMWRDLESRSGDLLRHPLVKRLATGEGDLDNAPLPAAQGLDERWPAAEVFCPLDADGTQLAAIAAAHEGHSFVIEGPPGTGKSQTIANLIAHNLAHGRSVLFVSQKRAALEVVHDRLSKIGLGPMCLELHSNKARKTEFIQQLQDAANFRARKPRQDWDARSGALQRLVVELSAYAGGLNANHAPGRTIVDSIVEQWEKGEGDPIPGEFDAGKALDPDWLEEAQEVLATVVPARQRIGIDTEPLEPIRATEWTTDTKASAIEAMQDVLEAIQELERVSAPLAASFGAISQLSNDDLDLLDAVLQTVQESPRPRKALLTGGEDEIAAWKSKVDLLNLATEALGANYKPGIAKLNLPAERATLSTWMSIPLIGWLFLWGVRARARLVSRSARSHSDLFVDYEEAETTQQSIQSLTATTARIEALVGAIETDEWGVPIPPDVQGAIDYAGGLRTRAHRFPAALDLASLEDGGRSEAPISEWRTAFAAYRSAQRELWQQLNLSGAPWGPGHAAGHLDAVAGRVQTWRRLVEHFKDWGAYRRIRQRCHTLGLTRTVQALEAGELDGRDVRTGLADAWRAWWLRYHIEREPTLHHFDPLTQTERERRFGVLDRQVKALCQQVVVAKVAARQPRLDQGAPATSSAGILLRQFKRKAGHATPRQLFGECAGLIRQLKPCVLMSPLSVAQYLDPSQPPFDLVVFDEASQVPLHEAIGAIARGRQVVVVGDSKQLPPTAFFSGASEEGEADDLLSELESVLDECVASGLPTLRLSWHYRSRHHGLIAFSNARYYDDDLQVLPAAAAHQKHLGLSVERVPGIYDRGGKSTNLIEAQAVVDDIIRRLKDPVEQKRSLCVVTFSRAQQALVEELLEEARLADDTIEPFLDPEAPEPLIVKNLENVQGDERDVVLFSIGYGPDAKGKMTNNMGPLGQMGGERRLNVAVTRAREQLVVYCSFDPSELDLSRTASRGLHDLKAFLETAERGGDARIGGSYTERDAASTAIIETIADRLTDAGWMVETEVGAGRWRLDLAVRSQRDPEVYALGVELDGPRYAATPTVRDRERLRNEVLGALGWRDVHRVRALAWMDNPEAVIAGVLAAAQAADVERVEEPEPIKIEPLLPDPLTDEVDYVEAGAETEAADVPTSTYQIQRENLGLKDHFRYNLNANVEFVARVVATEGPVSVKLVGTRLALAWGFTRSTTRMVKAVHSAVIKRSDLTMIGDVIWPADKDRSWRGYRLPGTDPASIRALDDVPLEELANCAQHLVQQFGRTPREDLMRETIKRFGVGALRAKAKARMALALDIVEQRGEVQLSGY